MIHDDISFDQLFKNKKQAVVCYMSLENRYQELLVQYAKIKKENDDLIDPCEHNQYLINNRRQNEKNTTVETI